MGDDVVDQVRRRLRHAPGPARRAEAGPLAAESDQLVVAAVTTADARFHVGPREGVGQAGLREPGEGGAFFEQGRTAPGGAFPVNTNGAGLCCTHPGMYGMFVLIEAVKQLRQDFKDMGQRKAPNAKLAVAHGTGGVLCSSGTLMLARS
jgi:acetyl-CoA acetyltransferase